MHQTTGDNCEQCKSGYYGQALAGTEKDCKKCRCPKDGPCSEIYNYHEEQNNVVCVNCPIGSQGNFCEYCEDGYYLKSIDECTPCLCNDNIDLNAIGNCDRNNGKCLRCVYNTSGDSCEKCLPGYWGNALTDVKCHACECYNPGTVENENVNENLDDIHCDLNNGQCSCKPNVIGRQCNECKNGFWNITSGSGCIDCKCDILGAHSTLCDIQTGQCSCKPGVTGLKCDQCLPSYFNLSNAGCMSCMCDPIGSISSNCDQLGNCKCKKNVSGMKCNQCDENKYDFIGGCLDCNDCYNLVQRKMKTIRNKVEQIEVALIAFNQSNSEENTNHVKELVNKLKNLEEQVKLLHKNSFEDKNLKESYIQTILYFEMEVKKLSQDLLIQVEQALSRYQEKFNSINPIYEQAKIIVDNAKIGISRILLLYNEAKAKFENISSDEFFTNSAHKDEFLTTLAKDARQRYEAKASIIKNLEDLINKLLENTKKSLVDLQSLDTRMKNSVQASEKVNASVLRDKIENLVSESETTKNSLDSNINELKDLFSELGKFSLSQDYQKNINDFEKSIEAFKQQQASFDKDLKNITDLVDMFIIKDSNATITKANSKFFEANRKFQEIKNFNTSITTEKVKCEDRIKKLNEMFTNAEKILETLKNFDEKISFSKQEAQKAELLKPIINENIENSRKLAEELRNKIQTLASQPFRDLQIVSKFT